MAKTSKKKQKIEKLKPEPALIEAYDIFNGDTVLVDPREPLPTHLTLTAKAPTSTTVIVNDSGEPDTFYVPSCSSTKIEEMLEDFTASLPPLTEYDDGELDYGFLDVDEDPVGFVDGDGDVSSLFSARVAAIEAIEEKQALKTNKLFDLTGLTRTQLIHLRDLFGMILSFDSEDTVSGMLATKEDRSIAEARLWSKLCKLFKEAEIPMGEEVPDFVIALTKNPELGIITLQPDDLEEPEE